MRDHTTFGIETTVVTFDDSTYFVPQFAEHRRVAQRILSHRYAEPELHRLVAQVMRARPGSMIHAGTFFGDMIPSFAAKCPGTVYAFEPVLENYLCARQTVEVNSLRNVVLNHAGLGTAVGVASLNTHDGDVHRGGGARVLSGDEGQQQTTILTIDQFAIDDLSLLQLDVEGSEAAALRGAVATIERNQPVIVIEDNRSNCAGLLAEMGYQPRRKIHYNQLYLTDEHVANLDLRQRQTPTADDAKGRPPSALRWLARRVSRSGRTGRRP